MVDETPNTEGRAAAPASETRTSETPAASQASPAEGSAAEGDSAGRARPRPTGGNSWILGASLALFVGAMVGAAYAAVPLYRVFCQVTGYGGATRVAERAPTEELGRMVEVRFDSNVSPGLPWDFVPETRSVQVRIGETKLVYYRAHNRSDKAITAGATYNVTPAQSGYYFSKLQCFCFTDQTLEPGETQDMPVIFFVDPELAKDPELTTLKTITLSYTFFPKAAPVATGKDETGKAPL
ncbi:cytochrome c oxidase assembly protein [Ancylobacter sp. MQZ15Z-1]|uniref:Cytochrome c oxidase assembly protein CtaG n=1 Tax=Ancylobacter mangrovi TaxID=2972472 RepID=A0A9X2T2X1_9HYPH|nr:cytochrome c oxidase assembly protein [Ancylobacter mangrovi]MCS0494286.1 cytochrome c oxidase assembly protein [Ancylobacter mangrovi]